MEVIFIVILAVVGVVVVGWIVGSIIACDESCWRC